MLPNTNPPRPRRRSVGFAVPAIGLAALLLSGLGACKKGTVAPTTGQATSPPVIDTAARLVDAQDEVARTEMALTKRFIELDKRRLRLAKSTPAEVEAYNRDAAAYSADLEALRRRHEAVKQMLLADAARRQAAPDDEQRAQACLIRLRAAININDWTSQVVAMEQALAQFRNTQAFAQISAVARPRLEAMTSADLERALARPAGSAPVTVPVSAPTSSEAAALVQQLRAIVNQPVQPEPKSGERVGTYNFHGGGTPLDYANVTREELLRDRMIFPQPQIEARDHPGVYYRGEDTEFNIRLKWYYADPTKPTKRLTDIEYDRIIVLSRRIASALNSPATASASGAAPSAPPANPSSGQVSAEELWPRIAALKRKWPR
jgi:hypothetical protein